jgi:hypothetical protein
MAPDVGVIQRVLHDKLTVRRPAAEAVIAIAPVTSIMKLDWSHKIANKTVYYQNNRMPNRVHNQIIIMNSYRQVVYTAVVQISGNSQASLDDPLEFIKQRAIKQHGSADVVKVWFVDIAVA